MPVSRKSFSTPQPMPSTGEQYVIVSQSVFSSSVTLIEKTTVNCHGVQAALLRLPSSLDSEWETVLTQLGLGHAKNIEVWPAGLAAAAWDGEGHGEWLASEHPCLAVSVDHKVDSLFVAIGNDPMHQLELKPVAPGQPTFVELPKLPVGGHVVRFSARKDPSVEAKLLGDLNVMVRIREARPWIRGISSANRSGAGCRAAAVPSRRQSSRTGTASPHGGRCTAP